MPIFANAIVNALTDSGCRVLAGLPGGGSNGDLIEAAHAANLRFVLTSTETGGAIIAATVGELTQAPGACLATLGPGAASMANGLAHSLLDRCPVVAFSDDMDPAARQAF